MSASEEFVQYILDLLEPLATSASSGIYSKPFFGGKALRHDDIQFAMIMEDCLYFCVDEMTRAKYEDLGMEPFSYQTKKGWVQVKKYYAVPVEWLEDEEALHSHTLQAIKTARKLR